MTFFSNVSLTPNHGTRLTVQDAPPVRRNIQKPINNGYGGAGYDPYGSSSSLSGKSRPSGGLSTSGSVSGMSLYIPPYVDPSRIPSSAPPIAASTNFAELGLPPGHLRKQSLPVGSHLPVLNDTDVDVAKNAASAELPIHRSPSLTPIDLGRHAQPTLLVHVTWDGSFISTTTSCYSRAISTSKSTDASSALALTQALDGRL
jgi:hypothetical protein